MAVQKELCTICVPFPQDGCAAAVRRVPAAARCAAERRRETRDDWVRRVALLPPPVQADAQFRPAVLRQEPGG
jgi:hypothetical protein